MVDVFISGPEGRIEARLFPARSPFLPIVVVLHPNPLQGGRMDNAVVQTMSRAFHEHGFGTLRFNFRGVGLSEGGYGDGEGELNDAAAALDWLQSTQLATNKFWVAGFSFGAWIAMQLLMRRPELESFVIASPPVNSFDFNFLAPCPVPGQIIYAGNDRLVSRDSVEKLVEKLRAQRGLRIQLETIDNADHSFVEKLSDLRSVISNYVKDFIEPKLIAV